MQRSLLLGLVLALGAPALVADAMHPGLPLALHQGPCEEQFFAFPLAMAEAETLTMPGFPPRPFDANGLTPANPLLATIVGVGYRCAHTTGHDLALGEVRTLGRALLVDPPAELRAPHITNYVVVLGGWTSDPVLARIYTSWHLPNVDVGEVSFDWAADSEHLRHGRVVAHSERGSMAITSVAAGMEEDQQPDTFRLFGFRGGKLAGYVDWSWPAGARTIESGVTFQQLTRPGELPDLRVGVAFHYFGAYEYGLRFTPLP